MKTIRFTRAALATLCAVLAACGQAPTTINSPSTPAANLPAGPTAPAAPVDHAGLPAQRTHFASVDVYKADAAQYIMRHNADHTFSGALPPMLPAVVVLRITVDQTGKVTQVAVQRSRDDAASKVALASMQRTGYLPQPHNLAVGADRSLTFSETFLFNRDYRFQVRTIAPPQ